MNSTLEHANITVTDPERTAKWLCDVFEWRIRWSGESIYGGHSIHVGSDTSYLAIYTPPKSTNPQGDTYSSRGSLNHLGIVVDDLEATEARVKAQGFTPGSHADYEPGRRFYFDDHDGVEFEVISYS